MPLSNPFGEAGMRLDPVDGEHAVRFMTELVLVHREAAAGGPDLHHLHARLDPASDARLGDAVGVVQHPSLPLGRRAAVAAHRRHHEGGGANLAQRAHTFTHHEREIRDAAARAGHRDALAGFDVVENRRHLAPRRRDEVRLGGAGKVLPELEDGRGIVPANPGVRVVEQEAGGVLHGVGRLCVNVCGLLLVTAGTRFKPVCTHSCTYPSGGLGGNVASPVRRHSQTDAEFVPDRLATWSSGRLQRRQLLLGAPRPSQCPNH